MPSNQPRLSLSNYQQQKSLMYIVLQEETIIIAICAAFPVKINYMRKKIKLNLIVLVCCCLGTVLAVKAQEEVLVVEESYLEIFLAKGYYFLLQLQSLFHAPIGSHKQQTYPMHKDLVKLKETQHDS